MMKKVLAIFLAFALFVPVTAFAAGTVYTEGFLNYTVTDGSITIVGCFGDNGTLTVPNMIAGDPVNTIAAGAFVGNAALKEVILPDSITTVEEGAFGTGVKVTWNNRTKDDSKDDPADDPIDDPADDPSPIDVDTDVDLDDPTIVDSIVFDDVNPGDYYYSAVKWAVEKKVTDGVKKNVFAPTTKCTRAQIVTFLWRAAGTPKTDGSNRFADVRTTDYCYDAVMWAVENGITDGTGATTFSPNDVCTRAQVLTFLWRYLGEKKTNGTVNFSDVAKTAYYYDAVVWAVENGVTSGTSATKFSPNSGCTRAQAVSLMYRAIG